MADQAPVPQRRDIPEIRLSTDFYPEFTSDKEFTPSSLQQFLRLSVNDKQKLLLQIPIPAIREHTGGQSRSNTQTSRSSSRHSNNLNEPIPEKEVPNVRNRCGKFNIDGRTFNYKYSSYEHVYQFLTPIWKKNQMSEDDFFSRYVQPYLARPVNYAELYPEGDADILQLLTTFQFGQSLTRDETEVQRRLQTCLYNPIERPLLETLKPIPASTEPIPASTEPIPVSTEPIPVSTEPIPESTEPIPPSTEQLVQPKTKNGLEEGFVEYLQKKGVGISPPPDLNTNIKLIPFFNTTYNSVLKMLGVNMVPDASLGYYIDHKFYKVGVLVGYVEVKTPSFDLEGCYSKLTRNPPDSGIHFDGLGISSLHGKTLKFLKTIRKYCTMCIHTGCDRFILVDYESYIFVHLDENVLLVQKDQLEASLPTAPILGREMSEIQGAKDRLVQEDPGEGSSSQMTVAPITGKGRKKKSKTQSSEAPKLQKSSNDNTNADSKSSFPLHLIAGRHFLVSRKHPHVRLYVLAFLAMTKGRWEEVRSFRENVIAVMEVEKKKTEREEELKHNTPPASQNASVKRRKTRSQNTRGSAFMASSGDASYYFEKNIFEDEYKIDFGPIRHSLLRVVDGMRSQVISIYSKKFIEKLSPIHPIFRKAIPKDIPDISVLKIFDPNWGNDSDGDDNYTYLDGVAMCAHELKVYERLRTIMGSYVPWIFSYGRTSDIHVTSGQWYPRFWGSFIQMEYIKPNRNFAEDISLDFVLNSIIPVYEQLHICGVVQNDFKLSNFIITGDQHEVKIIDFSSAIITNDENLFKEEIRDIKRYFNIPT